jgi:hypothetical protein
MSQPMPTTADMVDAERLWLIDAFIRILYAVEPSAAVKSTDPDEIEAAIMAALRGRGLNGAV